MLPAGKFFFGRFFSFFLTLPKMKPPFFAFSEASKMVKLSSVRHLQSIGERIFQNRKIFVQIEGLEIGYRISVFFGPEKNRFFLHFFKNFLTFF